LERYRTHRHQPFRYIYFINNNFYLLTDLIIDDTALLKIFVLYI
jgi:hypothetical protein